MQLYVASTQYSVQISVFLCYYTGLVSDYEKGILFIAKSQKKKKKCFRITECLGTWTGSVFEIKLLIF